MKKFLLLLLPFTTLAQSEIVLTRPTFSAKPDPIPNENGLYRFTHFMSVECHDATTGETAVLNQYININNGVVGIYGDDMAKLAGNAPNNMEGTMDLWAILPNKTQRFYGTSPEQGKVVTQMTAGDGMQTTTMARFDAWNAGAIFWETARKVDSFSSPDKREGKQTTLGSYDIYEFDGPEGKVFVSLKDLGPATGQYAPLKSIYSVVGMGGQGWILNDKTKHINLVFQITDATKQSGCRVLAVYPKTRQFSGAGYKSAGDMILNAMATVQQEQQQAQADQEAADNEETDAQIRELLARKRKLLNAQQTKMTEGLANAGMFNDMNEVTRVAIRMSAEVEQEHELANIGLSIEERRLQIQLDEMRDQTGSAAAERRARLRKSLACIPAQRNLWDTYKTSMIALRKKYPKPDDGFEFMEKAGELKAAHFQKIAQSCPE